MPFPIRVCNIRQQVCNAISYKGMQYNYKAIGLQMLFPTRVCNIRQQVCNAISYKGMQYKATGLQCHFLQEYAIEGNMFLQCHFLQGYATYGNRFAMPFSTRVCNIRQQVCRAISNKGHAMKTARVCSMP